MSLFTLLISQLSEEEGHMTFKLMMLGHVQNKLVSTKSTNENKIFLLFYFKKYKKFYFFFIFKDGGGWRGGLAGG